MISQRMQQDIEIFSKQQGNAAGDLMQNLQSVNRERYDYSTFLKKFAVMGEVMKINDDEFDYVYYTYGLKLYEKMPLIEPLEYKDVNNHQSRCMGFRNILSKRCPGAFGLLICSDRFLYETCTGNST